MELSRMHNTMKPSRKPKRFRSAFSTEQIKYLELQFKKFPYISSEHRKEIATALNMQERAVKIWFQNRRMKEKKESINIEFDYVKNNKVEESGKDRLNNTSTLPSANDSLSYSLPIVVKPVDTSIQIHTTNTESLRENVDTQQEPQNLSKNRIKSPIDTNEDLKNIKCEVYKVPFLNIVSTQQRNTSKNQFKNNNLHIQRKPTECSIDLSQKKSMGKEMNNSALNPKSKILRKLKMPTTIVTKQKNSLDSPCNKKTTVPMSSRPAKQGKLDEPTYFPVMPTVYAHTYVPPGSVIWKPINIMPIVAPGFSVPNNTQQSFGHDQNNCGCNCHGHSQPLTAPRNPMPIQSNPYAQYVITAPYQNSGLKF